MVTSIQSLNKNPGYYYGLETLSSTWTFVSNADDLTSPEVVAFQQSCEDYCLNLGFGVSCFNNFNTFFLKEPL